MLAMLPATCAASKKIPIFIHEKRELTVLLGNGEGEFTETPNSPFDLAHSAWHMAVAYVNAYGKMDLWFPPLSAFLCGLCSLSLDKVSN